MRIALVAALSTNRVIGRDNTLPWHLPGDLQYFKRITMGKPLLMGRKTYESIGRPLPGRTNIVLTRNPHVAASGIVVVSSPERALQLAQQEGAEELMVIGGEAVYRAMLPLAQRLYLTEVHAQVDGDAFFPEFDASEWQELQRDDCSVANDGYEYSFVVLQRYAPGSV
jgi:dihydrofolate reductase